jgi:hypothetical protein
MGVSRTLHVSPLQTWLEQASVEVPGQACSLFPVCPFIVNVIGDSPTHYR